MEDDKKDAPPAPAENNDDAADKKDAEQADEKTNLVKMPAMPKNPLDSEPYVPTDVTDRDVYRLTPCCCCLCACSHDRVGDATCFGCFPIRCGIIFIAMFLFFLAIILLIVTFFGLANEYLPWWYTFVALLLQIPLVTEIGRAHV